MAKNRIHLAEDDGEASPPGYRVYLDDAPSSRRFRYISWALVILAIGGISYYAYYTWDQKKPGTAGNEPPLLTEQPESLQSWQKLIYPASSENETIQNAINLYQKGQFKAARSKLGKVADNSKDKKDRAVAHLLMGVIDYNQARYGSAVQLFQKAVEDDPQWATAYHNLGLAHMRMNDIEAARKNAKKACELEPSLEGACLLLGGIERRLGNEEKSTEAITSGLEENPDDPKLLYNMAINFQEQGRAAEAAEYFRRVTKVQQAGILAMRAHNHLGSLFYSRSEFQRALDHFKEAEKLDPKNPRVHYNLGLVRLQLGKKKAALKSFRQAMQFGGPVTEIYLNLGKALVAMDNLNLAVQALERARQMAPANPAVLQSLGEMYYRLGNLDAAENMYRALAARAPDTSTRVDALNNLGVILDAGARYDEARQAYEEALRTDPSVIEVWRNLGIMYKNAGQADRAVDTWRRAMQRFGGRPEFRKMIADYYFDKKFWPDALNEYNAYIQSAGGGQPFGSNKELADAHLKAGRIYKNTGDFNQALYHFQKVPEITQNKGLRQMAHLYSALVYVHPQNGEVNRARDEAFKGVRLKPANFEAQLLYCQVLSETNSMNDREKAIETLTRLSLADAQPDLVSRAFNLLGVLYFRSGETQRALVSFQKSLDLNPNNDQAFQNLQKAQARLSANL